MAIEHLPLASIRLGARKRPVDQGKVADIAKSIQQQGLLQAIGVKPLTDGTYEVVFGAHRLAAVAMLEQDAIAASVLPPDLTPEHYLLMELQENSARNDLSGAQRQAYGAEIGRILAKFAENNDVAIGHKHWFAEMANAAGIPFKTLQNWWHSFCENSGITISPTQALEVHQNQFFDWLEERKRLEEEEQQRRVVARKQEQQHKEEERILTLLADYVEDYGLEVAKVRVIDVFLATAEG